MDINKLIDQIIPIGLTLVMVFLGRQKASAEQDRASAKAQEAVTEFAVTSRSELAALRTENTGLRIQLAGLEKENLTLRERLGKFESKTE